MIPLERSNLTPHRWINGDNAVKTATQAAHPRIRFPDVTSGVQAQHSPSCPAPWGLGCAESGREAVPAVLMRECAGASRSIDRRQAR